MLIFQYVDGFMELKKPVFNKLTASFEFQKIMCLVLSKLTASFGTFGFRHQLPHSQNLWTRNLKSVSGCGSADPRWLVPCLPHGEEFWD
jgi:hypothetical protein